MAAYRRVYDSRHLQADCQEPGSAPGPYARQSSMGYLYLSYRIVSYRTAAGVPRTRYTKNRHNPGNSRGARNVPVPCSGQDGVRIGRRQLMMRQLGALLLMINTLMHQE